MADRYFQIYRYTILNFEMFEHVHVQPPPTNPPYPHNEEKPPVKGVQRANRAPIPSIAWGHHHQATVSLIGPEGIRRLRTLQDTRKRLSSALLTLAGLKTWHPQECSEHLVRYETARNDLSCEL